MILLLSIIIGAVCLDQLTKWLAVIYLQGEPSFPLWKDVLHFTFIKNEGAAFGMLSQHRWVFMIVSTVAIVGLSVYLFRHRKDSLWVQIPLAMIIGGGIGNMIDRIVLGYVIDFIDFTLINFAVFNVADSFVSVGAVTLMGYLIVDLVKEILRAKRTAEKQTEEEQGAPDAVEDGDKSNGA